MKRILFIVVMMMLALDSTSMTLSKSGRKFIQDVEKCSLERYWDNGAYSIGYGHRMPAGKKQYKRISKAKAVQLLNEDLKWAEAAANRIIKNLRWKPTQNFYDGLVSVIYNCGEGGIYKTEFYKRLMACRTVNGKVHQNDLNFTVAAIKNARIPSGKYADGVKDRRYREHKMML
jgi:GH24 family phage-related lysozyme (muramidase)